MIGKMHWTKKFVDHHLHEMLTLAFVSF
jgi:hypothetical protein